MVKRCDVYNAFLFKINNKNLEIKTSSVVTKIILDQKKAIGVEVSNGKSSNILLMILFNCRSLCYSKILMHSGIGEEKQLNEFDIPVIENLKGVGKNLQDHHEVPVILE